MASACLFGGIDDQRIIDRLKDEEAVTNRLMESPAEIRAVFEPFYGPEVLQAIVSQITDHLRIGGALITALRDGQRQGRLPV